MGEANATTAVGRETAVLLATGDSDEEPTPGSAPGDSGSDDDDGREPAVLLANDEGAAGAAGRHCGARVFLTGEFVEKGYQHATPLYGPGRNR
jgi:hypothetical protein